MNYPPFRSNKTGATSGRGTVHSSVVTQQLIIVEEELPTLHSSEVTRRVIVVEDELPTLQQ
jgi:hypothetical protein